jgi:hypothetical protein
MTCGGGGWYCFFSEFCSGSLLELPPPPPPPQQYQMLQEMLLQENVKLGHADDMLSLLGVGDQAIYYLGQVLLPQRYQQSSLGSSTQRLLC